MPWILKKEREESRMERIERLHQKYEDWVRRGIVQRPKYIPTPTPEEWARRQEKERLKERLRQMEEEEKQGK